MSNISTRTPFAILGLVVVLFCVNVWFEHDTSLAFSETSFGVGPIGYKAAYDLFNELGMPVTRSYVMPSRVGHERMLWIIEPEFLSARAMLAQADADNLMDWIRGGGVALVTGDISSAWNRLDIQQKVSAGSTDSAIVTGLFTKSTRTIPVSKLGHFEGTDPKARAVLIADGKPFAVEKKVGAGRLIAIADSRFLSNVNLDQGDSSVLAVDLARAVGPPDFDEHSHGLAASESAFSLFRNPQLVTLLLFASIVAALWIGEQHSWPVRKLSDAQGPVPSLDSFVESLGALYSRSNNPQAVFRAYRASFLKRAQRQFSPRLDVSEQDVVRRLTRDRSISGESLRWLGGKALPANDSELVQAVRALESCPGPRQ